MLVARLDFIIRVVRIRMDDDALLRLRRVRRPVGQPEAVAEVRLDLGRVLGEQLLHEPDLEVVSPEFPEIRLQVMVPPRRREDLADVRREA